MPTTQPTPAPSPEPTTTLGPFYFEDPCVDGEPLVNGTVLVLNLNGDVVTQGYTDENGIFFIAGLPNPPGTRYGVKLVTEECPSAEPSTAPSFASSELPSVSPSTSSSPSAVPTMTSIPTSSRDQVCCSDPCVEGDEPLVGVTVYLKGIRNATLDQTITDSDGYYNFATMPSGMRFSILVDRSDCRRRLFSVKEEDLSPHHAAKFYKNDDVCASATSRLEGFAPWSQDVASFNTLTECCTSIFWFDINGCFMRSNNVLMTSPKPAKPQLIESSSAVNTDDS